MADAAAGGASGFLGPGEGHGEGLGVDPTTRYPGFLRLKSGFTVSCLPLPLVGGSAAPARVVAMIDDNRD